MGGKVRYGAALAARPEGPYVKTPGKIFEADKPGNHWMVAEDPFIFHSVRYGKRYYAVTRDVVGTFTGRKAASACSSPPTASIGSPPLTPRSSTRSFSFPTERGAPPSSSALPSSSKTASPTYLFGATDGYLRNGKISSNIQIPLITER